MRAAIVTISTSKAAGQGEDGGTPALVAYAESLGADVVERRLIADDPELISQTLIELADGGAVHLILTTGGTGLALSDVTPEATRAVIDREAPGIAEALRLASKDHTKYWMMSRGIAGLRGGTLIINFPGNPRAIAEAGAPLVDTLQHAMALLLDPETGH
jgi:molybdenum cofactor synthesis domain-containing protein